MEKRQISPPLINKSFSYMLLNKVLQQIKGNTANDRTNQMDLLRSMSKITDKYQKYYEDENLIIWRDPDQPENKDREVTYRFKKHDGSDKFTCSIGYGKEANVSILIAPNAKHGPHTIAIHDAHYHSNGSQRDDLIIQKAEKSCSLSPKNVLLEQPLQTHQHSNLR